MKIGVVFEGGGGKGSYQIGSWKAIREMGIEPYITCVSGTSVGALNAALFYKGNYHLAEEIWRKISVEDILFKKNIDDFNNGDCLFSQKKLAELIEMAIKGSSKSSTCKKCYVTCRYRDKSEYKYFEWSSFYDIELKKKVLLASAAIPVIFESIEIDGEWFVDGGANGDNIPVKPLEKEDLDCIIIIHLSNNPATINNYKGDVIEIFPSKHLGGLIDGTLDFDSQSVNERIELGYYDTKLALMNLADLCYRFKKPEYVKVKSSTYKKKNIAKKI